MKNLRITEEQFNDLYPDMIGYYDFFNDDPPTGISNEEFENKYLSSKLWRLNNCYTIIGKGGNPVTFRMNYAQHVVYARSRTHPRVIILKSRQQGISTLWLVSYFDDAVFCPFLNLGLMAQGTDEASTLLERAKFLWDMLDQDVKNFIGVTLDKDNSKQFSFSNNSNIFIRVSFRSATLQRLHVSEFGKIANQYPKRAKEVKTGTLQALGQGQTGIIESTAEGRNAFKVMWDDAEAALNSGQMTPKDFYPVFLSWVNDPDCNIDVDQTVDEEAAIYFKELEKKLNITLTRTQKNFWIAQRRELGGDIYQEYPATPEEAFTASRDGTYYARAFNEHVVRKGKWRSDVYDPNLPVDVYVDLGVDDYFVILYTQWYRGEWRIIDEYWNNGMSLRHYMESIMDSPYDVRAVRFPHDIAVREQGSSKSNGQAKSRLDIVKEFKREHNLRWRLDTLPRQGIEHGIECVRRIIPHLVVDSRCTYVRECMLNYSKKWDEKLQVWIASPVHDEFSHGADTVRQFAANTIELLTQHESAQERFERTRTNKVRNTGYDV
jgi:hypothetical protein